MKPPLGRLERVSLRAAWKHEAGEFTPWLAQDDNLRLWADALGLPDLELVATEHPVGDFKVDILCTDDAGRVIVENQLEKTNHAPRVRHQVPQPIDLYRAAVRIATTAGSSEGRAWASLA